MKNPTAAIWACWLITAVNLIVAKYAVPYITSALFLFLGGFYARVFRRTTKSGPNG